jgi:CheY-like chemotaxis protein
MKDSRRGMVGQIEQGAGGNASGAAHGRSAGPYRTRQAGHRSARRKRARDGAVAGQAMLAGVTVLVVEDDALTREALELIFTAHGAAVVTAATAEDALVSYERLVPSVIVSDIGLPHEDGFAFMRAIRTREFGRGRHTPAIAVSAFPSRETGERARGAGFDAFVPKPIDVGVLLHNISTLSAAA